jgi:hypothetical protein
MNEPREWKDECRTCHDSGWKSYTCTATSRCGRFFCERMGDAHTHTYYAICPCRATNGTYQRKTLGNQVRK